MTLNSEIKHGLLANGASLTGFADVSALPVQVTGNFSRAVSIAVALNPKIIRDISKGPTKEYFAEYERVNVLLAELCEIIAKVITKAGGKAEAVEATMEQFDAAKLSTQIQHKTIATLAGLGWIGKSALLITKKYGAAIRLGTVLTDAEFEVGEPVNDSQCGECRNCVEACPAGAIAGRNWESGVSRESIYDAFACQQTAGKLAQMQGIPATICGICINVCPWTQKYISREQKEKGERL
jgi:epoxyqueuosine reductase QueG